MWEPGVFVHALQGTTLVPGRFGHIVEMFTMKNIDSFTNSSDVRVLAARIERKKNPV